MFYGDNEWDIFIYKVNGYKFYRPPSAHIYMCMTENPVSYSFPVERNNTLGSNCIYFTAFCNIGQVLLYT